MVDFYKNRFKFFAVSVVIMIIGAVFIFINGVHLDIGFKGGTILKYAYTGDVNPDKVQDSLAEILGSDISVQITKDIAGGENNLVINVSGSGASLENQQLTDKTLAEKFPQNNMRLSSTNSVEPFIGRRFLKSGIMAIGISALIIVVYVWVRFTAISGLSAGVMALVALLHDCLMVFFTFIIFKIPIGDSFVAVILTIIGYSINDTIIIYDRIRENRKLDPKLPLEQLTNKSISQTLTRSLNTCITTLSGAIIVLIFAAVYGIDSIVSFALPMAAGLVFGCYSSICIAGPLWVMWQNRKKAVKQVN